MILTCEKVLKWSSKKITCLPGQRVLAFLLEQLRSVKTSAQPEIELVFTRATANIQTLFMYFNQQTLKLTSNFVKLRVLLLKCFLHNNKVKLYIMQTSQYSETS